MTVDDVMLFLFRLAMSTVGWLVVAALLIAVALVVISARNLVVRARAGHGESA